MDEELFVFQLAMKKTEKTFKTSWKNPAIMCMSSYGPNFGFTDDKDDEYANVLDIKSNPNKIWCTCSGFQNFTTMEGLKVTNETLAGSALFFLTRMEVFEVMKQ